MTSVHGMHPSGLRQRLCPYSICFLDVYLVCHGGELTTKRRQPLWTSVQISESTVCISGPMFITVYFFLVLVGTTTSQNIRHFLAPCICSYFMISLENRLYILTVAYVDYIK